MFNVEWEINHALIYLYSLMQATTNANTNKHNIAKIDRETTRYMQILIYSSKHKILSSKVYFHLKRYLKRFQTSLSQHVVAVEKTGMPPFYLVSTTFVPTL
jgi:hypothetical protein